VDREAYELAAKFRDQIVLLEGELGDGESGRETPAAAPEGS
jgi:protein-arginine kinase activator protein McsA